MEYMSNDEKEQSCMMLQSNPWNWTLTITSAKKDVSAGEMFLVAGKVIEKLQQHDENVKYAFYICKHGEESREHLHGVIYTSLKHLQVQSCIGAGHHRIKKFTGDQWWFSYMLNQSLAETEMTNCEIPVGDSGIMTYAQMVTV